MADNKPEGRTPGEIEAARKLFAGPCDFISGAASVESLPPISLPEVAFAGRSNVGKSSLINAMAGHGRLARTSNTPGRTQEINFFDCQAVSLYLVDMPGYGFAEAPKDKVDAWNELVRSYLRGRATLARVLLLIDARHGLKPVDLGVMALMNEAAVSYQIILTKADKISVKALSAVIAKTEATLTSHPAALPEVMATSSTKGTGLDELKAAMARLVAERRAV